MNIRMTDDELDAIDARQMAATPGPWEFETRHDCNRDAYDALVHRIDDDPELEPEVIEVLFDSNEVQCSANWQFISHAREDVPRLIAEVRRLNHLQTEDAAKIGLLRGAIIGTCERDDVPDELRDTLRKIISTVDVD